MRVVCVRVCTWYRLYTLVKEPFADSVIPSQAGCLLSLYRAVWHPGEYTVHVPLSTWQWIHRWKRLPRRSESARAVWRRLRPGGPQRAHVHRLHLLQQRRHLVARREVLVQTWVGQSLDLPLWPPYSSSYPTAQLCSARLWSWAPYIIFFHHQKPVDQRATWINVGFVYILSHCWSITSHQNVSLSNPLMYYRFTKKVTAYWQRCHVVRATVRFTLKMSNCFLVKVG